jgi:NAD+ synthase (glutamine-hydrolysing)
MNIRLVPLASTVGAISQNTDAAITAIARYKDADVIVFPELAITGYPPRDLVYNHAFVEENLTALNSIAAAVESQYVVIGYVDIAKERNPQGWYKRHNALAVLHRGEIVYRTFKTLLPTYDVFDEKRHFVSATEYRLFELQTDQESLKMGFQICEDLWDDTYNFKVTEKLANLGAEVIINISASPFDKDKIATRQKLLCDRAKENGVPILYCNAMGAQDELIFDGHCIVGAGSGQIAAMNSPFSGESLGIDTRAIAATKADASLGNIQQMREALELGIRDYIVKSGFSKVVLGLSGGIDSALVTTLAARALGPQNVVVLLMPSQFSSDHSVSDAEKLVANLGVQSYTFPIKPVLDAFLDALEPVFADTAFGLAEENLQARIRGTLVMAYANKHGALALATGNKTEFGLGYSTLYGDMCGALAPIGDLSKTEVYDLSRHINSITGKDIIPVNIIHKKPSAELRPEQYDPFDYDVIGPLLNNLVEFPAYLGDNMNDPDTRDTFNAIMRTEFKRWQAPPILKISSHAFGSGRKMPLVNHFRAKAADDN